MKTDSMGFLVIAAALAAMVTTRVPHHEPVIGWSAVAIAGAILFLVTWNRFRHSARPTGRVMIAGILVILLLPIAHEPAVRLPAWSIAILALLAMHVIGRNQASIAPSLANARRTTRTSVARWIPITLVAAAVIVIPVLYEWVLPARFYATYELHGAARPILPLLIVAGALTAGALIRFRPSAMQPSSETDNKEATP